MIVKFVFDSNAGKKPLGCGTVKVWLAAESKCEKEGFMSREHSKQEIQGAIPDLASDFCMT